MTLVKEDLAVLCRHTNFVWPVLVVSVHACTLNNSSLYFVSILYLLLTP